MDKQRRKTLQLLGASPLLLAAATPPERFVVSYNDDYAPYSYIDSATSTSRVLGILPDVLDPILSELNGLVLSNVGLPWRRAQMMVQQGLAEALCTFASDERKQYALFHSVPVVQLQPHLFFNAYHLRRAELERIKARDELKAFYLVDQKGNQWAEQVLKDFPHVEWTPGHDAIFRMVMATRGDVHISLSPIVTKWRLRKLGILQEIVSIPAPYIAPSVPFHLGIRKDHPRAAEILGHIDEVLRVPATQRRIEDVVRRYA